MHWIGWWKISAHNHDFYQHAGGVINGLIPIGQIKIIGKGEKKRYRMAVVIKVTSLIR